MSTQHTTQQGNKKTILITGVTRGIGRGLLENLANSDTCQNVIGICRSDSPHFNEMKSQFGNNQKVKLFSADVADFNSLQQIAQQLQRDNLHPDIVINNAGIITPRKPTWDVTQEELNENFEVNVRGVFNTMKLFLPILKDKQNSVMVNVSSDWGTCGSKGLIGYCMSKFAVEGMTKAAALDVENLPCSIVSVSPGMVYSDMLVEAFGEQEAKKLGVPCEKFIPHFVEKLWGIQKSVSGQHLDFAMQGGGQQQRVMGK
jgi:NAD(P)-dependent dehydrogenase (short-subunit alcohol dehydrogenase family)